MIPTKSDVSFTDNLSGENIVMSVDPMATAHIMSVLTNMYSDQELACIREYSTNAWDAQVEAGVTSPIEVTCPGPLSPYFKVKDRGVGLSVDDIRNVYSKYGASTKRDSNDFNGTLGIGGKSALTYTNQFTVVSVKNGVKATVLVTRDGEGSATMKVIDTCATTESNGTEITIPTRPDNNFMSKSQNFFRFWKEGTVLLNGKQPDLIKGTEVGDNIIVSQELREDYVVMGGVAYPCERRLYENGGYWRYFGIVAFVDMGDVEFAPSREALMYTPRTNATLNRLAGAFSEKVGQAITDSIANAPTMGEALKRYFSWPESLSKAAKDVKYKGQELPRLVKMIGIMYEPYRARYSTQHITSLDVKNAVNSVYVTGFAGDVLTARIKQKTRVYLDEKSLRYNNLVFVDTLPGNGWLDESTQIDYADIAAVKIETSTSGIACKIRNKYDVFENGKFVNTDTFDIEKDAYYFSPTESLSNGALRALTSLAPDAIIVRIGKNRWEKFKRDFPGALHVTSVVKSVVATAGDKITESDKLLTKASAFDKALAERIPLDEIDDPEVVEYLSALKNKSFSAGMSHYNGCITLAHQFSVLLPKVDMIPTLTSPMYKYPLVQTSIYNPNIAHIIIYINAVFNSSKEN